MQVQARVAGGEADGDSDKEWVTTRDQVLKGLEHVRNFMDANPESMAHFEGGWGGASVCLIGMRRGVEGCLEPMGQRQATLPELTAEAEEARKRREMNEQLDKLDKAQFDYVLEVMKKMTPST